MLVNGKQRSAVQNPQRKPATPQQPMYGNALAPQPTQPTRPTTTPPMRDWAPRRLGEMAQPNLQPPPPTLIGYQGGVPVYQHAPITTVTPLRPQQPQQQPYGGLPAPSEIYQMLQQKQDEANAANEGRYNELRQMSQQGQQNMLGDLNTTYGALTGLQGKLYGGQSSALDQSRTGQLGFQQQQYGRMNDLVGKYSNAEYDRENRRTQEELSNLNAQMQARGLGDTTADFSLRRGIMDDSALRQAEIGDRVLGRQMGVEDLYTTRYGGTLGNLDSQRMGLMASDAATQLGLAGQYGNNRQNIMDNSRREEMSVIEGRQDVGPNMSQWLPLLSQAGSMYGRNAGGTGVQMLRPGGGSRGYATRGFTGQYGRR